MADHQGDDIPLRDVHLSDEDGELDSDRQSLLAPDLVSGSAPTITVAAANDFEAGTTQTSHRRSYEERRVSSQGHASRSSSVLQPDNLRRESLGRFSTITGPAPARPRGATLSSTFLTVDTGNNQAGGLQHSASVSEATLRRRNVPGDDGESSKSGSRKNSTSEPADMDVIKRGIDGALGDEGGWLPSRKNTTAARLSPRKSRFSVNKRSVDDEQGLLANAVDISGAGDQYLSPFQTGPSIDNDSLSVNYQIDNGSAIADDVSVLSAGSRNTGTSRRPLSTDMAVSFASKQLSSAVRRIVSNDNRVSTEDQRSVYTVDLTDDEEGYNYPASEVIPAIEDFEPPRAPSQTGEESPSLRGNALTIFGPENPLRLAAFRVVSHSWFDAAWLVVLFFQTVVVIYRAISDKDLHDTKSWTFDFPNVALLAVFIFYSVSILLKMVVSGFLINPDRETHQVIFELIQSVGINVRKNRRAILRDFKSTFRKDRPQVDKTEMRLSRLAYLRSSWNRVDFIAVVCYWIYLLLAIINSPHTHSATHIFRALSSIQLLNWLKVTEGTREVLQSIKRAAPLLQNVTAFIAVFLALLALVGVQAFSGSFRRQCVWVNPDDASDTYTNMQLCGGYLEPITLKKMPFKKLDGSFSDSEPKGYLCPVYSICSEVESNPYNGTLSFDNTIQSLELIFIVLGMNGFSDLMNYMSESDHAIAAIYFVVGVIILSWWLFNLFIAVITTSFESIREMDERRKLNLALAEENEKHLQAEVSIVVQSKLYLFYYRYLEPLFVFLIFADFIVQAMKEVNMSARKSTAIDVFETVTTFILLTEMFIRFAAHFPNWRKFFTLRNIWDTILAIVSTVILLPVIRNSPRIYPWLTFCQVARTYRVVDAIRLTRLNWMIVTRNKRDFMNLVIFLFLTILLVAIIGSELFRGEIDDFDNQGNRIESTFRSLANSLANTYQVMTTEGWASMLFTVTGALSGTSLAVVGAIFLCAWFLFSNAVVMNLFIAVIQSNFDLSDEAKKRMQINAYAEEFEPVLIGVDSAHAGDRRNSRFSLLQNEAGSAVDENFLGGGDYVAKATADEGDGFHNLAHPVFSFQYWTKFLKFKPRENPFFSSPTFEYDSSMDARLFIKMVNEKKTEYKRARERYLISHPNFNRVLFCLRPENPIRRFCQRITSSARGGRYGDAARNEKLYQVYTAFNLVCSIVMVACACRITPFYQKTYYQSRGCEPSDGGCATWNWMSISDIAFASIFTIEALVKILADGFVYTPNAYILSTWNFIDFFVLGTLWIDILTTFVDRGSNARFLRAFKALRALRLLHVSTTSKDTFHNIIIVGIVQIFYAAVVSMTLLVPFALWGLNLFMGKLESCSDQNAPDIASCKGEFNCYASGDNNCAPYNWDIWMPRSYTTPGYNFDSFFESISILFQIISLEGWNDVLQSVKDITGSGLNPSYNHSVYNGLFVYVFNFISIAFISTLFITVVMENYAKKTGAAFLTMKQRSYLGMQRVLRNVKPSRTGRIPTSQLRRKCYNLAVRRGGVLVDWLLVVQTAQLGVLLSEFYSENDQGALVRDVFYLLISAFLIFYMIVRCLGLSWLETGATRLRLNPKVIWKIIDRNKWDVIWLITVAITFLIAGVTLGGRIWKSELQSLATLNTAKRLLMVLILCLLIPRSNRLNQLVVTATASLSSILSLLFSWLVLFIVYAIAFNQIFGLTRLGSNGSADVNFRGFFKSMLLLFRMSCGEGWNSIMYDYQVDTPFCINTQDFFTSDCGSKTYAYILFMSWNILSMYIFMNMFISLIYESFNYFSHESECAPFVSRDAIRAYKEAWDQLDTEGIGYIRESQLATLLRKLPPPFNTGIYTGEQSVREMTYACQYVNPVTMETEFNMDELRRRIGMINRAEIKIKRRRYEQMVYEICSHRERVIPGSTESYIPFSQPLMIIPFYKIPNARSEALTLKEFISRWEIMRQVEEDRIRNKLSDFARMVACRHRYLLKQNRITLQNDGTTVTVGKNGQIVVSGARSLSTRTGASVAMFPKIVVEDFADEEGYEGDDYYDYYEDDFDGSSMVRSLTSQNDENRRP
ncbi:Ion transport protein-domain-containing protein [Myxozyma melibiosi]|uniref:Ion transport protein-domain-containing protein n=1 Tax=Myxozyma melibiosi TaxID=54550 RepID=A0ABR1F8X5_9ASCO